MQLLPASRVLQSQRGGMQAEPGAETGDLGGCVNRVTDDWMPAQHRQAVQHKQIP